MIPLNNIDAINLNKPALIEASAGTGKTYTLSKLFIRALREMKKENTLGELEPISIESILIVTFTNAAAAELRNRLYASLLEEQRKAQNTKNAEELKIWNNALLEFDKAAITTIHSFCERTLSEFAFEGNLPFNAELSKGDDTIATEKITDFWRSKIYSGEFSDDDIKQFGLFGPGEIAFATHEALSKPMAKMVSQAPASTAEFQSHLKNQFIELRSSISALKSSVASSTAKTIGLTRSQVDDYENLQTFFTTYNESDAYTNALTIESLTPYIRKSSSKKESVRDFIEVLNQAISPAYEIRQALLLFLTTAAYHKLAVPNNEGFTEIGQAIRQQGTRTFDGLLSEVHTMLYKNPAAIDVLREKYSIVMIDEFQDTDPVQWDTFKKIFLEGYTDEPSSRPFDLEGLSDELINTANVSKTNDITIANGLGHLIVVGDPKQAIYSFRGGDIDTYLSAKRAIQNLNGDLWTLTTNYRSEPSAVDAVNRIFLSRPKADSVFKVRTNTDIQYATIKDKTSSTTTPKVKILQPANSKPLLDPTQPSEPGLIITTLDKKDDDGIARTIIAKIRELFNPTQWLIYTYTKNNDVWTRNEHGTQICPADICVLSNSNKTTRFYHQQLCISGIPCVSQLDSSIFEQEESKWIQLLLTVVTSPGNKGLSTLLTTPLFNLSPIEILNQIENKFEIGEIDYAAVLQSEKDKLTEFGIQSFFAALDKQFNFKHKILSQVIGERHWTNLTQTIEILNDVTQQQHLSPEALLKWLDQTIANAADKKEGYEVRLDSDAEAVTAMTIHKSKGLEFPIVFIPEIDKGHISPRADLSKGKYHEDGETIIDCSLNDEKKQIVKDENTEEAMRKFYVALTRAVHRTYWYVTEHTSRSPNLTWKQLKDLNLYFSEEHSSAGNSLNACKSIAYESFQASHTSTEDCACDNEISIPMEIDDHASPAVELNQPPKISPIAQPWILTSFSGIKNGLEINHEIQPDTTGDQSIEVEDEPDDEKSALESEASTDIDARYLVRGGTLFGNAMHTVFENCDFTASKDELGTLVDETFASWHCESIIQDETHRDAVIRMVHDTLNAKLTAVDGKPFSLAEIPHDQQLHELGFHLPIVSSRKTNELIQLVSSWGGIYEKSLSGITASNSKLHGMLKGFIDLTFEYDGRYYIIDWKTNKLHGDPASFEIDASSPLESGIAKEIAHSQYSLQWTLYALALYRYLRNTLAGYNYEQHFGGVRYLFVRGITGGNSGVWLQPPPTLAQITALDAFFG